jgi:hypothetical protein
MLASGRDAQGALLCASLFAAATMNSVGRQSSNLKSHAAAGGTSALSSELSAMKLKKSAQQNRNCRPFDERLVNLG